MKLMLVIFVWLVIAAVLAAGIVMAAKGSFWLLALGVLAFVIAVAKIGCLSH
jgi:hypothetical protein